RRRDKARRQRASRISGARFCARSRTSRAPRKPRKDRCRTPGCRRARAVTVRLPPGRRSPRDLLLPRDSLFGRLQVGSSDSACAVAYGSARAPDGDGGARDGVDVLTDAKALAHALLLELL